MLARAGKKRWGFTGVKEKEVTEGIELTRAHAVSVRLNPTHS